MKAQSFTDTVKEPLKAGQLVGFFYGATPTNLSGFFILDLNM